MKILHLVDSLDFGGAEKLLTDYIPHLPEFEHFVVVLKGPRRYPIKGFQYVELGLSAPIHFLSIVYRVKKIVYEKEISIIHSHSYWTNIISRIVHKTGIKLFNHYHFADYGGKQSMKGRLLIFIDQITGKKELTRIAVSQYLKQLLGRYFSGTSISLIPNFIKCNQVFPNHKRAKNVLRTIAVGNFNKEKNYDLAIDCFQSLQNQPVELHIYGEGPLLDSYKKRLDSYSLKNIKLCGHYPDIPAKMKDYDLFLSTSLQESFGIVVLEAMCAGIPMLLSDIPSYREIAPTHTTFFNPKNKNDLQEKILKIIECPPNPDLISYEKQLSIYSLENFISRLRSIYLD